MSGYAAFYNVHEGMKAQAAIDARRASADSSTSSVKKSKRSLSRLVEQLKPIDEAQRPAGIYTPIIKHGPLFQGLKPAETKQAPTPIYQRERPLFGSFSQQSSKSSKASSVSSA